MIKSPLYVSLNEMPVGGFSLFVADFTIESFVFLG